MVSFFKTLAEIDQSRLPAALCIITRSSGSTPGKVGAKMLVYADNSTEGTIGGGNIEQLVTNKIPELIEAGKPTTLKFDLTKDAAMECGGKVEVYVEPLSAGLPLFIFGAGHVGKEICKLASGFGFNISLIDPRTELIEKIDIPGVNLIEQDYLQAIEHITFNTKTYIVIVTPKHKFDEDVLRACINKDWCYLGMIGSKNKIESARKKMIADAYDEELLNKVDMPIGVNINSVTPDEIAVSIVAGLIHVKNKT